MSTFWAAFLTVIGALNITLAVVNWLLFTKSSYPGSLIAGAACFFLGLSIILVVWYVR